MRRIADSYIKQVDRKNPTATESWKEAKGFVVRFGVAITLGVLSIALYVLLYKLSSDIRNLALETYTGHKTWFFVPILLAFLFSVIHGSFTAHFWEFSGDQTEKILTTFPCCGSSTSIWKA